MHRRFFLFVAAAAALPAAEKAADLTPVEKWISRQAKVKSLAAEFKQSRVLKTVKKPLESTGRFWFAAPNSIRWQSGDPPKIIAAVKNGGDLTVLHVDKHEAEVFSRQQLNEKADGQGIAFLDSGFPKSFEEFQKRFQVTDVEKVGAYFKVQAKLAGTGNPILRKVEFYIQDGTWMLGGLHFHFRDGSRVETTFTRVMENQGMPDSQFTLDLTGCTVKKGS